MGDELPSDRELHQRWKELGDHDAFDELWKRHFRYLMGYGAKYFPRTPFEDLALEAFLDTIQRDANAVENFRAYACTVIRNKAIRLITTERRTTAISELVDLSDSRRIQDEAAIVSQEKRIVLSALSICINGLPQKQSEVIQMKLEGLTDEAIGERLGISPQAVQQRRQVAMKSLQTCLQEKGITDSYEE